MAFDTKTLTLLDEETGNITGEWIKWAGTGSGTLQIDGTWDGATITIQGKIKGSASGASPANSVFTELSTLILPFDMGIGLVRAIVTDVGGSTSLSVYLSPPERD